MQRALFVWFILTLLLVSCESRLPFDPLDQKTATPQLIASVTPDRPTKTPLPTQTPFPRFNESVSVVFLGDDQFLNVYANPGEKTNPIAQLAPHMVGIKSSGKVQMDNEALWIEIEIPQGGKGWVNAENITSFILPTDFCNNPKVPKTVEAIMNAIKKLSEGDFLERISPVHGLRVRYLWQNQEVNLGKAENLKGIFTENKVYDWGFDRSLNQFVQGSFKTNILPSLESVFDGSITLCNILDQGIAADWSNGYIEWPIPYINLNYIALYHPASEEDALTWRTWALGMEEINDELYLTTMVQYKWEY